MLTQKARYIPTYFNTGNHEHYSQEDMDIFQFAFEQYGQDKR